MRFLVLAISYGKTIQFVCQPGQVSTEEGKLD